MKVFHQIEELSQLKEAGHLAIGVFDGLHLGHQEVIGHAIRGARESGGRAVVVTFDPHPVSVLRPDHTPRLLTSTIHKQKILESLGVDALSIVRFDSAFAQKPADAFVNELVAACRPLAEICVGRDWEFGSKRSGNVRLLTAMGEAAGFKVTGVEPVMIDGSTVSSTLVRKAVQLGNFDEASKMLGRDYTVLGTVVGGRQLGRTIGFPTANLSVHCEQLPPSGVYAVRSRLGDRRLIGVGNLGTRPTVEEDGASRLLEIHLFDFDEEIYGQEMEITFESFLRTERKFDGVDALKEQIAHDAQDARACLF